MDGGTYHTEVQFRGAKQTPEPGVLASLLSGALAGLIVGGVRRRGTTVAGRTR